LLKWFDEKSIQKSSSGRIDGFRASHKGASSVSLTQQEAMQARNAIQPDVVTAMAIEVAAFRRLIGSAQGANRIASTARPLESYWLAMEIAVASCRGEPLGLPQLLALRSPVISGFVITQAIDELQQAEVIGTVQGGPGASEPSLAVSHRAARYLGTRAVATVQLLRAMGAAGP
jgi:hypothetical protein